MSEQNDYSSFRKNVVRGNDRIDRIENIRVDGMPDTNVCLSGIEAWIEFKSPKEPKRATTPLFGSNHKVSQDQKNWFLRQTLAGGRCYFLIVSNKHGMLLPGQQADYINLMTVAELLKAALWSAPRPLRAMDWARLREILLNDNRDNSRST